MVGHTGVLEAAIQAVEKVDECVGSAVEAVKEVGGVLFICADHGNAEQMINYETGAPGDDRRIPPDQKIRNRRQPPLSEPGR